MAKENPEKLNAMVNAFKKIRGKDHGEIENLKLN
jgi:hypothetical protein